MVSAVFYQISNIGFCIYIKWINPLTLESNISPESQKTEDGEKEKHCIGRIGEPCQFVSRRWDHVTNTTWLSGSGSGSVLGAALTAELWAVSMNEPKQGQEMLI